jgi:NCAIR mutase (PurE)-related protein
MKVNYRVNYAQEHWISDKSGRQALGERNELGSFAELDFERQERCGFPEVVYGAGKTPEQVALIMQALAAQHEVVLCTRATSEQAEATRALVADVQFVASCGILFVDRRGDDAEHRRTPEEILEHRGTVLLCSQENTREPSPCVHPLSTESVLARAGGAGSIIVCCAGTSDLSVAQEAALTAHLMGSKVTLLTDVGISGVHRVLSHEDELRDARAIIAVAGMEGALPSLVAGLVDVPVIAVPTSVGYGASFGGIAALLGMLNSCAGGVSVVNIDNGFGAGVVAHRINVPPTRFSGAVL